MKLEIDTVERSRARTNSARSGSASRGTNAVGNRHVRPKTLFSQCVQFFSPKAKNPYRLVDFKDQRFRTNVLLSQTACDLEILREGIMVSGDFSVNGNRIPVLKSEIQSITMMRGKEVVDTFFLSPMHILSKFGVPNRISRYVSMYPWEYKITETRITIKCQECQLRLITGGNRYEKIMRKLKKAGYSKELQVIERTGANVLSYSVNR